MVDINTLLETALHHYQSGQLEEAGKICNEILSKDPAHAQGNYILGMIAYRVRRFDAAEKLLTASLINHGNDAYLSYKALGNVFRDQGKTGLAAANYKRAAELKTDDTEALNNLGSALFNLGKTDEALQSHEKVLALNPQNALALYNSGVILEQKNRKDDAKEYYLRAIAARPDLAQAYNNIGNILRQEGKVEESREFYEKAVSHKADYAEAWINLGNIQNKLKDFSAAEQSYLRALAIRPNADAYANLGLVLQNDGRSEEAAKYYLAALDLNPKHIDALNNLGTAYLGMNQYEKSHELFLRVLEIEPENPQALNNIANLYKSFNQLDKAITYYKRALKGLPDNARIYTNVLLSMVYSSLVSPQELYETAVKFDEQITSSMRRHRTLAIDKNPDRRLRIGYVSPDFHHHSVNYFFENLLDRHNHDQFEIFAYSNVKVPDNVTGRLKQKFDHWRDIRNLGDDEAADMIESDKIDILIDLTGHTGDNRLLVFARKPAPVQVTWLGYPATTGMKAMDYRITDSYAEPPGMTEHLNVEKLWRLPDIFCCYGGHESNPAVIDHPPCEDNGYTTFGCFNNFSKVTDSVLETWSRIMQQIPNSRLLLEIAGLEWEDFRQEVQTRLTRMNLPLDRVILEPRKKSNQFVLYNKIDIALDPFPCVGGTTSMDTAWMGVPLITLAGDHFTSRMGVSILSNIGLPELIASDLDQYVEKAVALANDSKRLKEIRHNLRQRVETSPMMNQKLFALNMEHAYRAMWREYCARSS